MRRKLRETPPASRGYDDEDLLPEARDVSFIQEGPQLQNPFEADALLRLFVEWRWSSESRPAIESELRSFGARCAGEYSRLAQSAESEPPRHIAFDPWGRRIDRIEVSSAWRELHEISAREGLVALGYERPHGSLSRLLQFAKLYLFHPSSAFYTCPLAMTDGAARVLELRGTEATKSIFEHLTSRDPARFWTSGQWMTERTGGSDVSRTSTTAQAAGDGRYALSGDKWFTSATTSEVAMALAKVDGALSLFLIELRDSRGALRNIRINRLKEKLGTHALPTAELTLDATPGILIGGVGEGVKTVASMLNITRLYNACTSLATMQRALQLARDYATRREVFGHLLSEQPLHQETLADLRSEFEPCFLLGFHLIHLLGKQETSEASREESMVLRLMTPVLKAWSAKLSVSVVSEVLESFGGAGYIEDTGLPRLLRDAQVFPIWEGTTNILSLDVLRVLEKGGALEAFQREVEGRLRWVNPCPEVSMIHVALRQLREAKVSEAGARAFAFSLARVLAGALAFEFGSWSAPRRPHGLGLARRFFRKPLVTLALPEDASAQSLQA